MLRFMRIRDFALIRELEIEFRPGLNLLTGETGSGKSIIVDALSLLIGERASQDLVRSGREAAILEASFELEPASSVLQLLSKSGIDAEDGSLLIRREISAGGRSRVFINNTLATLSLLKGVGEKIVDIHGQHDHQALLDLSTHLEWLDRFGRNQDLVLKIEEHYKKFNELSQWLDSMAMDEQQRLRRVDILEFQLKEIRKAELRPGEKEELENERNLLANRERIYGLASEAYQALYENEPSLLSEVKRLEHVLRDLQAFDSLWSPYLDYLREAIYKLEDLAYTARDYTAGMDFSPQRLEQVEQRLAELDRLGKKYGASAEEVLAYAAKCENELNELVSYADTSRALAEQFEEECGKYLVCAERLSEKRRADAARFEREIRKEFQSVSMEQTALEVYFRPNNDKARSTRIPSFYGPAGIDHVEFQIAPNKGEEARALARIASGGELSRVMLAIKSLCGGGEPGKTLVFDEVDAGIGGRVAEVVGRRLKEISEGSQVLCVTHLPQIAAFAAHHHNVRKEALGERTETFVSYLDGEGRIEEVARMLGGEIITETTRRHAREMLTRRNVVKNKQA